ncbi:MAG: hypothetical protein V4641_05675 [Pseudomonadota bacterium]
MKPTIGRTIIVKGGPAAKNGTDRAPAVITRVWNDTDTRNGPAMVNATMFCDLSTPQVVGSMPLFDDEAQADAANTAPVAFWPERN